MKIVIVAKEILQLNILISNVEFSHLPLKGDYIDVLSYVDGDEKIQLEESLNNLSLVSVAKIFGRSWQKKDGENILYLHLEFETDDDLNDEDALLP